MKIAGLLLMISGVMMLIALILQIPAIIEVMKSGSRKAILNIMFYDLLLLLAGTFLLFIGRKVRRSTFN